MQNLHRIFFLQISTAFFYKSPQHFFTNIHRILLQISTAFLQISAIFFFYKSPHHFFYKSPLHLLQISTTFVTNLHCIFLQISTAFCFRSPPRLLQISTAFVTILFFQQNGKWPYMQQPFPTSKHNSNGRRTGHVTVVSYKTHKWRQLDSVLEGQTSY